MLFDARADLRQESIGQRRNDADPFIQNNLFDAMNRKEDGIRLNAAFLAMRDVCHPVFKCIQVDAANRNSVSGHVQEASEETFSRILQIHDHDGIEFQNSILLGSPSTISFGSVSR